MIRRNLQALSVALKIVEATKAGLVQPYHEKNGNGGKRWGQAWYIA